MSAYTETDERFIQALRDVVAAQGRDHVYDHTDDPIPGEPGDSPCWYSTTDGRPLCVVGHALDAVSHDYMPNYEIESGVRVVLESVERQIAIGFEFNPRVRHGYWVAQRCQDKHLNWGIALDGAEQVFALDETLTNYDVSQKAEEILEGIFEEQEEKALH